MHALWIFIFRLADAEGPEHRHTVPLHAVVGHLDPFHAERRDGVDVGDGTQPGAPRPGIARNETDAGSASV